mmetsp:Transcript_74036/g.176531  ORF Transcript_74036/g.176531 Transcript_74036/m.176531 type:complete len:1059 (+) Transcript_74036:81-3257(+)
MAGRGLMAIFAAWFACLPLLGHSMRAELEDIESQMLSDADAASFAQASEVLLRAADSFYMSTEMMEERREAEGHMLAAGLQELGLEVQDRFRLFALGRALKLAQRGISLHKDPEPRSSTQRWKTLKAMTHAAMSGYNASCEDSGNLNRWLLDMTAAEGTRQQANTAAHLRALQALRNYCRLKALVKAKDGKIEVSNEDFQRLRETTERIDGHTPLEPVPRGSIHQTAEEKRQWHKAEAMKDLQWIGNWNPASVQQLKGLFLRATVINRRLSALADFITKNSQVDWMTVEKKSERKLSLGALGDAVVKGVKFVGKYTMEYIAKLGKNTQMFFVNCWSSFKQRLSQSERRCKKDGEKGSLRAAKKANLGTDMGEEAITARAQTLSDTSAENLQVQTAKVDEALNEAADEANRGALPEEEARETMRTAKETAQNLQGELVNNSDDHAGVMQKIDDAETSIETAETHVCRTARKGAVQHLKAVFTKAQNVMKSSLKVTAPNLAIRGAGVSAAGIGGGVEEVIDFRNREIGQFRWGSGSFGPSVTGASLGGYAGFGWKGYKQNWTLQEAYVTGLFTSASLTPSIFGINAGLGVTFATDADNSVPGPWVPEPHGVNGVTLGWSAGFSIFKAAVPMSVDVGASYYWYLNSECFSSLSEMVKYIWLPLCKDCSGASEHTKIAAIRSGIKLTSFPIISETVFSLMATVYDKFVREDGYETQCSPSSVTLRHDASHYLRQLGELVLANAKMLEEVRKQFDKVVSEMVVAEMYNPDFEDSEEYDEFFEAASKNFDTCAARGPINSIEAENGRSWRKEMSDDDLTRLCESYSNESGLDLNCHNGESREAREERVANYEQLQMGMLSLQELDALIYDVRPHSKAGKKLKELQMSCKSKSEEEQENCLSSVNALKVLQLVDDSVLSQICQRKGLDCKQPSKMIWKACTWCKKNDFDAISQGMKILLTDGGGTEDQASADHPFGTCTTDADCWLENTRCMGEDEERFCGCKENTCYALVPNPKNQSDRFDLVPACEARENDWRTMSTHMRRSILTYRHSLGELAGQIASLPSA